MSVGWLSRGVGRKRAVVGAALGLGLALLLLATLYRPYSYSTAHEIDSIPLRNLDSFLWHTDQEEDQEGTNSSNRLLTCRNSVQGKILIVDDRGMPYVL
jgi:hypothetical protein